jgi:tRNA(His) 5'-end guanylyltransferase
MSTPALAPIALGDRIKSYECFSSVKIPPNRAYAIRLDGHAFRTFTRPFPSFDKRIHAALKASATHLLLKTRASIAYCCSDEITLIFPLEEEEGEWKQRHMDFSGRVEKLASLCAAQASVVFYQALLDKLEDNSRWAMLDDDTRLGEHIEESKPHFDARVLVMPEGGVKGNTELINAIFWRVQDYIKNSVSQLAQQHFSEKKLKGLNTDQRLAKLVEERDIHWEKTLPHWAKFGCFLKLQRYTTEEGAVRVKVVEVQEKWNPRVEGYKIESAAEWMLQPLASE